MRRVDYITNHKSSSSAREARAVRLFHYFTGETLHLMVFLAICHQLSATAAAYPLSLSACVKNERIEPAFVSQALIARLVSSIAVQIFLEKFLNCFEIVVPFPNNKLRRVCCQILYNFPKLFYCVDNHSCCWCSNRCTS
jgi:hypothetical protein